MNKITSVLTLTGFWVGVGCALTALGAGLGYRIGWWHYRAGIATLGYVFWVAVGAAVACVLGLLLSTLAARSARVLLFAAVGLVVACTTALVPYKLRMTARALPPINDITTDIADPPQFVRVAALRRADDHPVAYDGAKVGEQQKKAYPDIVPLILKAPRGKVFAAVVSSLREQGLEIDDSNAAQGRIEATATSMLFGFKDDVVVRLRDEAGATRVDVRSKSRVGRNDFGMNAKRIRVLVLKLKAVLDA